MGIQASSGNGNKKSLNVIKLDSCKSIDLTPMVQKEMSTDAEHIPAFNNKKLSVVNEVAELI